MESNSKNNLNPHNMIANVGAYKGIYVPTKQGKRTSVVNEPQV